MVKNMFEINKNSSTPIYIQIAQLIKNKIDNGEYQKNQILPSEMEIQKNYSISRITVRKSYELLIKQGIVRTVRGKGTYVNDLEANKWTWMNKFTTDVKKNGREPSTKIVSFRIMECGTQLSKVLNISPLEEVYYFKRIRLIDNVPVWLTRSYIPVNLVEGLSKEFFSEKGSAQSIFYVLENDFNIKFGTGENIEYISDTSPKDFSYLNIKDGKDVEKVGFIAKDENGCPVVYEKTIFEKSYNNK